MICMKLSRIVRHNRDTVYLTLYLRGVERDLAMMPAAKIGTQWCLDRLADRNRVLKSLANRGALN